MAELVTGKPIFQGNDVFKQLHEIVHLLGIPDEVSLMPLGVSASMPSQLRDAVPEERLSAAGFDVLRGLLNFDQSDRLTAAAALQMPWFTVKDADAPSPARA
jgi:cyclin-dependent kinase/cell division cycle 2-like protein